MRTLKLLLLSILIAGCGQSLESKVEKMVLAKNKWLEVSNSKDYSYVMEVHGGHTQGQRTIEVISGKAVTQLPGELTTIKDLFEFAFDALKDPDMGVEVTYSSEYGYPTKIEVENPNLIDGRTIIIVRDLEFK